MYTITLAWYLAFAGEFLQLGSWRVSCLCDCAICFRGAKECGEFKEFLIFCAVSLTVGLLSRPISAAQWSASVDQRNGLPSVSLGGAIAITVISCSGARTGVGLGCRQNSKRSHPSNTQLWEKSGTDFDLNRHVTKPFDQELAWEFELDARAACWTSSGVAYHSNWILRDFLRYWGNRSFFLVIVAGAGVGGVVLKSRCGLIHHWQGLLRAGAEI